MEASHCRPRREPFVRCNASPWCARGGGTASAVTEGIRTSDHRQLTTLSQPMAASSPSQGSLWCGAMGRLVRAAACGHAALQLVRSAVVGGNRRCPRAAIKAAPTARFQFFRRGGVYSRPRFVGGDVPIDPRRVGGLVRSAVIGGNRRCPNTSPSRCARHLPARGGFWYGISYHHVSPGHWRKKIALGGGHPGRSVR